ncbi:fibrinogen C domain-containing protein 1-like [Lucilia sericata]|uniref:fibrinogen C domain-containing protein 1-like n=1 Tax=Lucilia sericata TaxID=13632 RepID=UPI0018A840DF|nr:fibrinogen C domain-containing protein 1-like [Lucilia sericata]
MFLYDEGKVSEKFEETQNSFKSTVNDSSIFDIRYDEFPAKCKTNVLPRSCAEATSCTRRSGIYKILLTKYSSEPFLVECDVRTEGGGWILIQRRQDGSVDFYRDWSEYQNGFGNIEGEFFIGLNKLHALTNYNGPQELLIVLEDNNEIKQAKYSNFVIGNESEMYALKHLGVYSGNAGDCLISHLGMKFSTKDRDNDEYESNCAVVYTGAWWYKKCHVSNLNGKYGDTNYAKGITWQSFRGYNVSIKHAKMMIRRRQF